MIDFKRERIEDQAALAEAKPHPELWEQRIIAICAQMAVEELVVRQDQ